MGQLWHTAKQLSWPRLTTILTMQWFHMMRRWSWGGRRGQRRRCRRSRHRGPTGACGEMRGRRGKRRWRRWQHLSDQLWLWSRSTRLGHRSWRSHQHRRRPRRGQPQQQTGWKRGGRDRTRAGLEVRFWDFFRFLSLNSHMNFSYDPATMLILPFPLCNQRVNLLIMKTKKI